MNRATHRTELSCIGWHALSSEGHGGEIYVCHCLRKSQPTSGLHADTACRIAPGGREAASSVTRCERLRLSLASSGTRFWLAVMFAVLMVHTAAAAGDNLAAREQKAFQAAVDRVAPSVVRIETIGGRDRLGKVLLGSGPTSGLVVDADGLIVSSAFGFAGRPDSILVQLADGTRKPARLVATDRSRKLVLLKIEPDDPLPMPKMAPDAEARVGQWAIGVGRTFEVDRPNVSVGIVSALGRIGGRAIQTDAAASPANYGGPLVDVRGRVLGVLVPLSPEVDEEAGRTQWYDTGIGFAVPADDVRRVVARLRQGEDLFAGRLGISFGREEPNTAKPVVAACHPDSPASKTLKPGDRITAIDGVLVDRVVELENVLGQLYAGDRITISFQRDGKQHEAQVVLAAELPSRKKVTPKVAPR